MRCTCYAPLPLWRARSLGVSLGGVRVIKPLRPALRRFQPVEANFPRKPAQTGRIQTLHQVGGGDENALKRLHLGQQFIDLGHFPRLMRRAPIPQERIGFIQHQHRIALVGIVEHRSDALLRLANVLIQQIGRPFHQQRLLQLVGQIGVSSRNGN